LPLRGARVFSLYAREVERGREVSVFREFMKFREGLLNV
jgi:hypothetical protein